MAAQACLCLAWSETPEDTFCRVVAQLFSSIISSHCCFVYCLALVSLISKTESEPPHDKPNKVSIRPAKTQTLCAQSVAKGPSFLHADSEDTDQTGRMPRLI